MESFKNIPERRLSSQLIVHDENALPVSEVVAGLGMIQAQDYLAGLWAVGLRAFPTRENDVEQALANRQIVRSWPARGTLHFTAAADLHWMLSLLSGRVITGAVGRFRNLELDESIFNQCRDLLIKALQGGRHLTRGAVFQLLENARISAQGQRGIHIIFRMALEGLICFGPREGKQQTFVLLAEWVPEGKKMDREEALAELACRYFLGHGPATLADLAWWSGLTLTEARAAIKMAGKQITCEEVGGRSYWASNTKRTSFRTAQDAVLLPAFDEYLVGYKERNDVLDPRFVKLINAGGGLLKPAILINGQVVGIWSRSLKKESLTINPYWFIEPTQDQVKQYEAAAQVYADYLNHHLQTL